MAEMREKNNYVGKQIGSYRVTKLLSSRGGFGTLYLATHIVFESRPKTAIKLIVSDPPPTEEQREQFLHEARLLEQLEHRHILPIIDAGIEEDNKLPYFVIEYAPNGSLHDRLQLRSLRPFSLKEALNIISQIGQALHYAHQHNIIHRDIKPDNILFDSYDQVLLADFGIAVVLDDVKTKAVDFVGTPYYMAPEQFEGKANRKTDQYALGCIAYELLTGRRPFTVSPDTVNLWIALGMQHTTQEPPTPSQFNPSIPMSIEQVILTAMQKQPDNRYSSIMEFLEALGRPLPSEIAQSDPQQNVQTMLSTKARTATSKGYQKTVEQWLEEGGRYAKTKRYDEALDAYEQATRLNSKSAEAYYLMGEMLANKGEAMEALSAYNQAVYLNPKFARAYIGKGDIHFAFKNYEEARKDYEEATRVAPKLGLGYYKQGRILVKLQRYNEAVSAYNTALRYDPTNIDIYERKAKLLKYLRKPQEMVETYNQLLRYRAEYTPAYLQKITILEELGDYDEALVTYDALLKLDPTSIDTYQQKISLQRRLHQDEGILATYAQMIQAQPDFLEAYYQHANLLTHLGRLTEAVVTYDHVLQRDPISISAYEKKIQLLERLQHYPEVLATYHQLIKVAAEPMNVFMNLINFQERHHMHEGLLATYNQIMQQSPSAFHIYLRKAELLRNLGRHNDALATYERILQRVPTFIEAHEQKIHLLESLQRYDETLVAYNQLMQVSPDWQAIATRKISLLEYLKRDEALLEEYNTMLRKNPVARNYYYEKKISLLEKLRRDDEALAVYDQLAQHSSNPIGVWMRKIDRLEQRRRYGQTIEACNQAIQLFPSSANLYYKKGQLLTSGQAKKRRSLPHTLTLLRDRLVPDATYKEAITAFEEALSIAPRNALYREKIGEMLQRLGKLNEARKFQQGILRNEARLQDVDYIHACSGIQIVCLAVLSGMFMQSWGDFLGIFLGGAIATVLFALILKRIDQPYHLYSAWLLLIPIIVLTFAWTGASVLFFHFSLWGVVLFCSFFLNALLYFLIDIDGVGKLKHLAVVGFSLMKKGIKLFEKHIIN